MLRSVILLGGLLGMGSATLGLSASAMANARPNVVVILADDQGWGDLSVHGNRNLQTPHIDSLAKAGASFERFLVCPVCSPTRAEFLTGRYHPRTGVWHTSAGGERLNRDESTLAEALQAAGYATAMFGKWHNGGQGAYHPLSRGFDEFYGFCSGHWGDYFSPPLEHNGQLVRGDGYLTDDFTSHAIDFMEAHRREPFFVYLAFNTPHSPMQVPDKWWDRFRQQSLPMRGTAVDQEDLEHTRAALAMCENIDFNVGRVLTKLDELALTDNTIVVYFSDNGPNGARWNGGMRGIKGSTDEGGVRSPLLIRWPQRIPAGLEVTQLAAAMDLLPTLLDLTGVPRVGAKPLDGESLAPYLVGGRQQPTEREIFSTWNGNVSVRTPRYRLDAEGRLYDMLQDPGQTRDVAAEHPQIAARLRQAVARWRQEVLDPQSKDDRPFEIGCGKNNKNKLTILPAGDGQPQGGIKRSNQYPNSSFFTHWTRTDDAITWDVNVCQSGTYRVRIAYTCPAEDVGSTVELSLAGQTLKGVVSPAHDPPLRGGEHDRVPRQESYVKDFAFLELGEMELPEGRAELKLRALDIPGATVMDMSMVTLEFLGEASE